MLNDIASIKNEFSKIIFQQSNEENFFNLDANDTDY